MQAIILSVDTKAFTHYIHSRIHLYLEHHHTTVEGELYHYYSSVNLLIYFKLHVSLYYDSVISVECQIVKYRRLMYYFDGMSRSNPISYSNKTDRHNLNKILLKVVYISVQYWCVLVSHLQS